LRSRDETAEILVERDLSFCVSLTEENDRTNEADEHARIHWRSTSDRVLSTNVCYRSKSMTTKEDVEETTWKRKGNKRANIEFSLSNKKKPVLREKKQNKTDRNKESISRVLLLLTEYLA
jgi:hypothetical protein